MGGNGAIYFVVFWGFFFSLFWEKVNFITDHLSIEMSLKLLNWTFCTGWRCLIIKGRSRAEALSFSLTFYWFNHTRKTDILLCTSLWPVWSPVNRYGPFFPLWVNICECNNILKASFSRFPGLSAGFKPARLLFLLWLFRSKQLKKKSSCDLYL